MQAVLAQFECTKIVPEPGVQAAIECLGLLKAYSVPEKSEDPVPHILGMMDLANSIAKICSSDSVQGGDKSAGMIQSCDALLQWAESVKNQCCAKALEIVIANPSPEVPWNYQKMLLPQYHPLAMSLQKASGLSERLTMLKQENPDLEERIKELSLVESVWSALQSPCMAKEDVDPMFRDLKSSFSEFVEAHLSAAQKGLTDFQETHFPSFQKFNSDYEPVATASEKWQMGPVAWAFTDQHDQTKESLEQVMAAKQNVDCIMASLKTFCGHGAGFKGLADVINIGKEIYKTLVALIDETNRTAGILMIGCVIYNGCSVKDAKSTYDVAHASFGTTKETLPTKMHKLLADLMKTSDENPKDKQEKPAASTEKGKKRKADAEEKAERKKKEKKSKDKTEKNQKTPRRKGAAKAKENQEDSDAS